MRHMLALVSLALFPLSTFAYTDSNGLEWEDPVPEVIEPERAPSDPVDVRNDAQFDEDEAPEARVASEKELRKKRVDQMIATTCEQIIASKDLFPKESITRTTKYFLPLFPAGPDGGLQKQDRRACINMEGACVVDKFLYNWVGKGNPWGKRYVRASISFPFGKGSGQSYYNATNALDPCRTVAADETVYPTGTVLYIPSMRGKICPQNLKPVDGCFIVGDKGSAIQGRGRFDLYVGECAKYDKATSDCGDEAISTFTAAKGDSFYVVGRHNILAKSLREETDLLIRSDWRFELFPIPPVTPKPPVTPILKTE